MKILCKKIIGVIAIFLVVLQITAKAQDTLDYAKIEKSIDKYLSYFSDDNPGAVISVIKDGDIIFNKAYGLANKQSGEKMGVNKLFNIGELSKSFTSIAIMQLVEKHKLNIDDNLNDIFDNFPEYGEKVKIRYLLNHTSGLASYNTDSISSIDDVVSFLAHQKDVEFVPGSNLVYSNSDYAVLIKIIEEKSGMSYKDFLNKYIFKKLSMKNTSLTEDIGNISNVAIGHFKENDKYSSREVLNKVYGKQGVYTNAEDYAKFDKALYTNKLLSCESLKKIFSVEQLSNSNKMSYYGYAWVIMKKNNVRYYWHGGSGNGYSNLVLHLPDTHTTVLLLTNRNDGYDFLKMSIFIAKEFDKNLNL